MQKTVLITGCSSGFGFELVNLFLKSNWIVIATVRNLPTRRNLFEEHFKKHPHTFHLKELDMTSPANRIEISNFIQEKFSSKLNCLINNAGYGVYGSLEDASEKQIREQMETNFFGLTFLTREMIPYLRNAQGRIINISSAMGFWSLPLFSLYSASKFAVEGLSEALYHELRTQGIQVAIVEPGQFRKEYSSNVQWAEKALDPNSRYLNTTQLLKKMQVKTFHRNAKKSFGAVTGKILCLAETRKMPFKNRAGKDAQLLYCLKRLLPEKTFYFLSTFMLRTPIKDLKK